MEPAFFSSVTLQFWGDDLDPEAISKALGAEPTIAAIAGGPLKSDAGDRPGPAKTGTWSLRSSWDESETPDEKINSLFSGMTQDIRSWQNIVAAVSGRLICNVERSASRQSFQLSAPTLAMIAQRGLPITFVIEQERV
jgi:hypothetical protein